MNGGRSLKATIAGFVGALFVFAVLFWSIDLGRFLAALSRTRIEILGLLLVLAVGWVTAWGLALRTVLRTLGIRVSVVKAFFLYASALFASNVTPFGQVSGEPAAAAFISRLSTADYEVGLASIASVDTIHFLPSIMYALLGLAYYATFVTLSQYLLLATIVLVALGSAMSVLLVLGWQYRYSIKRWTGTALTPPLRRIGRAVPWVSAPPTKTVERRIEAFFISIERIAVTRRGLLRAIAFSALGWLLQMGMLWLVFLALRQPISLLPLLFVVPIANLADIVPVPGGLGAIDTAFVLLLVSVTPVDVAIVTAAVVVFRAIIYGFPTVIGGSTVVLLGTRSYTSDAKPR